MDRSIGQKVTTFFAVFKPLSYKKGEIIIRAGDNPSGIFYLEEGLVKKYAISQKGDEVIVNYFKSQTFFPMSWVVADVQNNYYYEALTNIIVRKASKQEVLEFVKKEPDVVFDLLRRVYIGTEGVLMHIEHLMSGDAYAKLLVSLLIFAKRFGKAHKDGVYVDLKMSERDLASYSGIARETVSRELLKLTKKGLVTFANHHLIVKNLNTLEDELAALE